MTVALCYDPAMAAYRFGDAHPMLPERFSLAVDLMRSWDMLNDSAGLSPAGSRAEVLRPSSASEDDLLLAHAADYVRFVRKASIEPGSAAGHGIGYGDTPPFPGMHDAAALAVGGTVLAIEEVLKGRRERSYAPAGGLHHARHDHASGFCVYNDCVVGIERAARADPGLRVAYVDIDAHHGDGVEAAFYDRSDVLTVSVHESGRYLFPGSGRAVDVGIGAGTGYSVNVPLPPYADPECYELAFAEAIAPALRAFGPDLIVLQAGGDSHRGDPLTHLYQSVAGFLTLVSGILALSEELTGGRIVVLGGGGYQPFSAVPRMWAGVMALMLGREVPEDLPAEWLDRAGETAVALGFDPPSERRTFEEALPELDIERRQTARDATRHALRQLRDASPLLRGAG